VHPVDKVEVFCLNKSIGRLFTDSGFEASRFPLNHHLLNVLVQSKLVSTPHFDGRVIDPTFWDTVISSGVKFKQIHKNLPALKSLLVETLIVENLCACFE
jgi:hypothetical protein